MESRPKLTHESRPSRIRLLAFPFPSNIFPPWHSAPALGFRSGRTGTLDQADLAGTGGDRALAAARPGRGGAWLPPGDIWVAASDQEFIREDQRNSVRWRIAATGQREVPQRRFISSLA